MVRTRRDDEREFEIRAVVSLLVSVGRLLLIRCTDAGDACVHQVEETRRQFPTGCGVRAPDQVFRIDSDQLFDELVARLGLTVNERSRRLIAASPIDAPPPAIYVHGRMPGGLLRRRDPNRRK